MQGSWDTRLGGRFAGLAAVVAAGLALTSACSNETLLDRLNGDDTPSGPYSGLLHHPHIATAKAEPGEAVDPCSLLDPQDLQARRAPSAPLEPPHRDGDMCAWRWPDGHGIGDQILLNSVGNAHHGDPITVRGNSAVRDRQTDYCEITVAVNQPTDPNDQLSPTPELNIVVLPIRHTGDPCVEATDLATRAFDRLPAAIARHGA